MKQWKILLLTLLFAVLITLSACGTGESEDENTDENDDIEAVDDTETETEDTDTDVESEDNDGDVTDSNSEAEEAVENDSKKNQEISENTNEDSTNHNNSPEESKAVVLENDAFKIFAPDQNAVVDSEFIVTGEAATADGILHYEFEDGHNILDEGMVDVGVTAPDWGSFEFTVNFDEVAFNNGTVILYEKGTDGSRLNQLYLPVTVE